MSTVYGRKIGTDSTLGVKCDICGEIYWTDLTGQSFPDHVREAVQHGWKNTKQNGKWLNLCPECDEYRRKQKREATLTKDCTGCRWKDRPQKCSCCRRNQNLKDCYEEAQAQARLSWNTRAPILSAEKMKMLEGMSDG